MTPLQNLRQLMQTKALDAYIVPSEDAHQSEYVCESDMRRSFLSGFTGSAGTAVVTASEALLWTDGRYYNQAAQELDQNWQLMKQGLANVPSVEDWLVKTLKSQQTVGVDPFLTSLGDFRRYSSAFKRKGISLTAVDVNLVDEVWGKARPSPPTASVKVHPLTFAGQSTKEKVDNICQQLKKNNAGCFVVCALDEVAWLFNLRGSDIPYNPVFFAYAIVFSDGQVVLYIHENKIRDQAVQESLSQKWITVKSYDNIVGDIRSMQNSMDGKVWLDPLQCSMAIFQAFSSQRVLEKQSPLSELKSIKNETEIQGLKQCHVRDGAALVKFLAWLDEHITDGSSYSEIDVSDVLENFRSEQDHFVGLSFPTISGAGPNGAIIHYHAEPSKCKTLSSKEMYLVDSGGQYLDGTTDITRTVHFGDPSEYEKECFTRVLIGHIRLASTVFPVGTTGHQLDSLARCSLWSAGLNYNHGTGHGVGAYLNVHEGPQGISAVVRRLSSAKLALKPGMTMTNEPGFYENGKFGIRIESVMLVKPVKTRYGFDGEDNWLGFETIALAPIQLKLIDVSLLSADEINWLNAFHQRCEKELSPLLPPSTQQWLHEACRPL